MWNRKELKEKAKMALKNNYWKCVIVTIIIALIIGSGSAASVKYTTNTEVTVNGEQMTSEEIVETISNTVSNAAAENGMTNEELYGLIAIILAAILSVIAVVSFFKGIIKIFVGNIILIGGSRFFAVNTEEKAEIKEVLRGFKAGYLRNVLAMFLRNLYIALWSLLFIIPGLVKAYSYRLVPYILADNPEMGSNEAITMSRMLMKGSKWRTFVLDLSFLGWEILSLFTLGLLHVFYVNPYIQATNAELYKALVEG